MFKLVVSLALLALCQASLYPSSYGAYGGYDHDYYVDVADNHIVVSNKVGQKVHIYTDHKHIGGTGHFIQIHVSGPGVVLKSKQYVHDPATFEGPYQPDILYQIFTKHSGPLDEVSYEKLLEVVHQHVQDGTVHPAVLYALRILSHHYQDVSLINPAHQEVYKSIQKLFDHAGVEKDLEYSRYNHLGSAYGHHGIGDYEKSYGVSGLSGAHELSHQSYYPGLSGQHDLSHQSYYPGVHGAHDWTHQYYGSQYPLGKQSSGSHYPVSSSYDWTHHPYGSHYAVGSGVQDWSHRSVYPGVGGLHDWSHQPYGSHYPVHGQDWSVHSYAGPYSSGLYDNVYGHGVGEHHWGQTGVSPLWQGLNPAQHHVVV